MPSFKIIERQLVLEKKVLKVFTMYGHDGHLGHVDRNHLYKLSFPFRRMLHMKFGIYWPSGFRGENLWKWLTDDGRTQEHGYYVQ